MNVNRQRSLPDGVHDVASQRSRSRMNHYKLQSTLGTRLLRSLSPHMIRNPQSTRPSWQGPCLEDDFLVLPLNIGVRRRDENTGKCHYELVQKLAQRTLEQLQQHEKFLTRIKCRYITQTLLRNSEAGLGMTLINSDGTIRVHSFSAANNHQQVDIHPGDEVVGINGTAFVGALPQGGSMLQHVVKAINLSPDPIVVHLFRPEGQVEGAVYSSSKPTGCSQLMTPSLLDGKGASGDDSISFLLSSERVARLCSTPEWNHQINGPTLIHPFASILRANGILHSYEEERTTSLMLSQFTERARQLESTSSFYVDGSVDGAAAIKVRKGLSCRILNSFPDGNETAFSIWVYDAESGVDYFAPLRYLRDFYDLRSITLSLCPCISKFPFPQGHFSLLSPRRQHTESERVAKCHQLESFLRSLCAMSHHHDPSLTQAQVVYLVQSFLGCDANLREEGLPEELWHTDPSDCLNSEQLGFMLKRSIAMYTHRIFLIDPLCKAVDGFLHSFRDRGAVAEDLEVLEAQGRTVLKKRVMDDLDRMKRFLDTLQALVLDGCHDDFMSIAGMAEYRALRNSQNFDGQMNRLFREAVREVVEIEVYVPLRSIVSRWLVQGWRHDDMEVQFKMKELRSRQHPSSRSWADEADPCDWSSVTSILSKRVAGSTLPSTKLRAIVDAAREVLIQLTAASTGRASHTGEDAHLLALGADQFLPVFIHCVVQADMERPCALCVLLRTLCDPFSRTGEVGYYLASFEAAITHIQEMDLSDEKKD